MPADYTARGLIARFLLVQQSELSVDSGFSMFYIEPTALDCIHVAEPELAPIGQFADYAAQLFAHCGQSVFNMGRNGANLNAFDHSFLFQHFETTAQGAWVNAAQRFLKFAEAPCIATH